MMKKWNLQLGRRCVAEAVSHAVDFNFDLLRCVIILCLNGCFFPQLKLCDATTDFFKLLDGIAKGFSSIIVFIGYGTFLRSVKLADVLHIYETWIAQLNRHK